MFAKKSLGQNFLKSKAALHAMVEAAKINNLNEAEDRSLILEIGPGKGTLTEALLEQNAQVVAIEKDDRLIEFLQKKFKEKIARGQLKVIHGDALLFDPSTLKNKYKIVANIPYYITGLIFRKFLSGNIQPSKLVIMVQKEIADRIIARDI